MCIRDRLSLHAALGKEVHLATALGAHLGQELRSKGAVLDLGQNLLHLLAGLLGDQALAGAVIEMCIRDRYTMSLKNRSFLKLLDYTPAEIEELLDLAADLKAKKKAGIRHNEQLAGKNIALIFEKTSTRCV